MELLTFFWKLQDKFSVELRERLVDERDLLLSSVRDEPDLGLRLAYWNGYVNNCEMIEARFTLTMPEKMASDRQMINSLRIAHMRVVHHHIASGMVMKGSRNALIEEYDGLLSKFVDQVKDAQRAAQSVSNDVFVTAGRPAGPVVAKNDAS